MEKKFTTAAGASVTDNDNAITAGPAAPCCCRTSGNQHFRKYE
jgi:catalase